MKHMCHVRGFNLCTNVQKWSINQILNRVAILSRRFFRSPHGLLISDHFLRIFTKAKMTSETEKKKPLSPTFDNNTTATAAAVQAKYAQQLAIAAEQV